MTKTLLDAIAEGPLVGDGAMGTQLQYAGLEPGGCGEAWNLDQQEKVLSIQRAYVHAGSDCLTANTFGACRIMLKRHGLEDKVEAINRAGVQIAREAFGGNSGFVLGNMGPFGGLMEPFGEISPSAVRDAFCEQAEALVGAEVDAILIETQTAFEELGIAIAAAREAAAPCVISSMAYDVTTDGTDIRTMMGIGPEDAASFMRDAGADIIALNCGTGMDMPRAAQAIEWYHRVCDLPVMVQPNAGLPVLENMKVVYKMMPEEFIIGVPALLKVGTRIIGGCCGSTPNHIRLIRETVDRRIKNKANWDANHYEI